MLTKTNHMDRIKLTNIILAVLFIITLGANIFKTIKYRAAERFEWGGAVSSTIGYTIQVAECNFFHTGEWGYNTDNRKILNEGWDQKNFADNNKTKSFYPDSLKMSWYSYTEQKFYEGNFALPYNKIVTQAAHLRTTTQQYEINYARAYPDQIIIYFVAEVAAGGRVTVWATDNGKRLQVGKYQALPVKKNWGIFNDSYGTQDQSKTDIAVQTALVMEKHPYTLELVFPEYLELTNMRLSTHSQKYWEFDQKGPLEIPVFNGIPDQLNLSWKSGRKTYSATWSFQDAELLAAFRKLQPDTNGKPLVLKMETNESHTKLLLTLKNNKTAIPLKSAYDNDIDAYEIQ